MRRWAWLAVAVGLVAACSTDEGMSSGPGSDLLGGAGGQAGAGGSSAGAAGASAGSGATAGAAGSSAGAGATAGAAGSSAGAAGSSGASAGSSPQVCSPGQSIACTGPAGCQGGQACKADGSGYEACDCGSAGAGGAAGASGAAGAAGSAGGAAGSPVCSDGCPVYQTCAAEGCVDICKSSGEATGACKNDIERPYGFLCSSGTYPLSRGCVQYIPGSKDERYCCSKKDLEE